MLNTCVAGVSNLFWNWELLQGYWVIRRATFPELCNNKDIQKQTFFPSSQLHPPKHHECNWCKKNSNASYNCLTLMLLLSFVFRAYSKCTFDSPWRLLVAPGLYVGDLWLIESSKCFDNALIFHLLFVLYLCWNAFHICYFLSISFIIKRFWKSTGSTVPKVFWTKYIIIYIQWRRKLYKVDKSAVFQSKRFSLTNMALERMQRYWYRYQCQAQYSLENICQSSNMILRKGFSPQPAAHHSGSECCFPTAVKCLIALMGSLFK